MAGYCDDTQDRASPAYRVTVGEDVDGDRSRTGHGSGSSRLSGVIARCEGGPWRQMLAIIGDGNNNKGSLNVDKKHGLEVAGQLRSVGYKMGDWRDTLIMPRPLGDGDWPLPE